MIELNGVGKAFGSHVVLRNVSFSAARGEVTCLLGPSGSGKSTVLRCINGLERHDAGEIRVDGDLVSDATLLPVRRKAAMVFQRFNLFPHRTVLENVVEGPVQVLRRPIAEAEAEALTLLERVGMADFARAYPAKLSGGQQQRVGIARALAMRPSIILFDEPTSALDPERVGEVLQVMRGLAVEGMTMIVVTHEIAFARDVGDRAIFMDGGVVVEQGAAREVLTAPRAERTRRFLDRVLNPL
ncbi:amino acid ABC transporter ATP-binding protein [Sphingobium sp. LSP13-1-1.1]|uniref:amino acid ABC transporter ATP-binding protein n=1 Tax=Sphingobium sp. LSP13-1-1.1 TaxID=3135234 RepID=UPI0034483661